MTDTGRQQRRRPTQPPAADDLAAGHDRADAPGTASCRDATAAAREAAIDGRDVRDGQDVTAEPDSGHFGVGSNTGKGNDNLERETEPGFQADKWERGPVMPR